MKALKIFKASIVIGAIFSLVAFATACSASYNLNKDDSVTTKWGTMLQYKIDKDWEKSSYSINDKSMADEDYHNSDDTIFVGLSIDNTNDSSYKYSTTSTYADWQDSMERRCTATPTEQAEEYKTTTPQNSSYYDDELADADCYPTYSDYSLSEKDPITINNNKFRIYKLHYKATSSDTAYTEEKENNPNAEQSTACDVAFALIKDGTHDIEVSASSEALLKSYLNTLEIKW
ncbi:MAG: hypothetical protein LKF61_03275 [Eggerthellaceae bacterium]|jgi:hypothetical protein|nr:hypothetical protein [Eggerthellaceae bacterium]